MIGINRALTDLYALSARIIQPMEGGKIYICISKITNNQ